MFSTYFHDHVDQIDQGPQKTMPLQVRSVLSLTICCRHPVQDVILRFIAGGEMGEAGLWQPPPRSLVRFEDEHVSSSTNLGQLVVSDLFQQSRRMILVGF